MTIGPHLLGWIPDPPDSRDHLFGNVVKVPSVLPATHNARAYYVYDQGNTPDCVTFSGSLVKTIAERADEHRKLRFDALGWYAATKLTDGAPTQDGTYIRAAAKVLQKDGVAITLSPRPDEIGKIRKALSYARILDITEIKTAILLYGAAWAGSSWYDSWFKPFGGILPPPDNVAGGHAYAMIGWSDARGMVRCQNSWGAGWGQKGRFWLPYKYIDFNDFDIWRTIDVLGDF